MHFTPRRIAGYVLPLAGYFAARLLHNPNAGDHRPVAWLLPIGCFIGALLLIADLKAESDERSGIALCYGFVALLVALYYGILFIVFNGWMHGF